MKRFFFSLIALSAVAVGCTQSALLETPDLGGTEISFSPYTGRTPVTKATEVVTPASLSTAGGFQVYSFLHQVDQTSPILYLDNTNVYSEDGGATWKYNGVVYWPDTASESTLSFVGYSSNVVNKVAVVNGTGTDKTPEKLTYTHPRQIDQQVDFLATNYLVGRSLKNGNGTVQMQFHHLLSRVGFSVRTTTDKEVYINSISLSGRMNETAELYLKNSVVSPDVDVTSTALRPTLLLTGNRNSDVKYEYLNSQKPIKDANKDEGIKVAPGTYMMILPHTIKPGDDHFIEMKYQFGANGSEKTARAELEPGFEFKAGKAYELILEISTSSITFNVTVKETGWNDTEDDNEVTYPVKPSPEEPVTVYPANSVKTTSATLPIAVNHEGLYEVGVEYVKADQDWTAVTSSTTITLDKINGAYPVQSYDVTVTGLAANTNYKYRAYSKETSDSEKVYSESSEFSTKMTVTLADVLEIEDPNVTESEATLTGGCGSAGVVEYGFCYVQVDKGTVAADCVPHAGVDPTVNNIDNAADFAAGHSASSFTATLKGLPEDTFHVCWAYVKDANGKISYSAPDKFKTLYVVYDGDDTGAGWN